MVFVLVSARSSLLEGLCSELSNQTGKEWDYGTACGRYWLECATMAPSECLRVILGHLGELSEITGMGQYLSTGLACQPSVNRPFRLPPGTPRPFVNIPFAFSPTGEISTLELEAPTLMLRAASAEETLVALEAWESSILERIFRGDFD